MGPWLAPKTERGFRAMNIYGNEPPDYASRIAALLAPPVTPPPSPLDDLARLLATPPKPEPQLVNATGLSGRRYVLRAHKLGDRIPKLPGVYCFTKRLPDGDWYAIYIGEAEDLSDRVHRRLWSHEKCLSALIEGATHIAIAATTLADRENIESDLRWAYDPPLNRQ